LALYSGPAVFGLPVLFRGRLLCGFQKMHFSL
jgi:hypothetical protein